MKYYFLEENTGIYSAPWDIPGGSVNDSVKLLQSDCTAVYNIYDDLARRYPNM